MSAIRTFLFWSTTDGWISRLIRRITKGQWSHTGVGFRLEDCSEWYFEAHAGKGVRGPLSIKNLEVWGSKDGHRWWMDYTELSPKESEAKWIECLSLAGHTSYSEWQLVCMWAFERFGIPVPRSPHKMVCSELTSRVLTPEIDLRDKVRTRFDEVNPNSAFRAWMRLHANRQVGD
jgi:hypothetical protein